MGRCMEHLGHTLNKYGTLVKTFCIEFFLSFSQTKENTQALDKSFRREFKGVCQRNIALEFYGNGK